MELDMYFYGRENDRQLRHVTMVKVYVHQVPPAITAVSMAIDDEGVFVRWIAKPCVIAAIYEDCEPDIWFLMILYNHAERECFGPTREEQDAIVARIVESSN